MSRKNEFSPKTKLQRYEICKDDNGKPHCEKCGSPLVGGNRAEYDHDVEIWEGGDNSLENCRVLGSKCCHQKKTATKAGERAKCDRNKKTVANARPEKQSQWPYGKNSKWKAKIGGGVVRR